MRIALRGWDDTLVDLEDARERDNTRYVLQVCYESCFSTVVIGHDERWLSASGEIALLRSQ